MISYFWIPWKAKPKSEHTIIFNKKDKDVTLFDCNDQKMYDNILKKNGLQHLKKELERNGFKVTYFEIYCNFIGRSEQCKNGACFCISYGIMLLLTNNRFIKERFNINKMIITALNALQTLEKRINLKLTIDTINRYKIKNETIEWLILELFIRKENQKESDHNVKNLLIKNGGIKIIGGNRENIANQRIAKNVNGENQKSKIDLIQRVSVIDLINDEYFFKKGRLISLKKADDTESDDDEYFFEKLN